MAATQADVAGSDAAICSRSTASGMMRGAFIHGSRLVLIVAADRPFLHPRQVVVGAVTVLPHRQDQREIRLGLVLETLDHRFELGVGVLGMDVGVPSLKSIVL